MGGGEVIGVAVHGEKAEGGWGELMGLDGALSRSVLLLIVTLLHQSQ